MEGDGFRWRDADGERVQASEANQAFAYPDEPLEIALGVRGSADSEARLLLIFRGLEGAVLREHALPLTPARVRLTAPDRPSLIATALELKGSGRLDKVWLRIEPATEAGAVQVFGSALFNRVHYLSQLDGEAVADASAHYLAEGEDRGLTPHPWFDPVWYRETYMVPTGREGSALLDYMTRAAREPVRPHPLFDAEWYGRRHALDPGASPLEDFLQSGDRAHSLAAELAGEVGATAPPKYERPEGLKPHRISFHAPYLVETAEGASDAIASDMAITVIGPAATEAEAAHVRRVFDVQDHPAARLVIVDPGEDRAAALNAALDTVSGEAVAFLDSDSDWRPDHLSRLAARMRASGAGAVFASWKRIEATGRERWLGQTYDPQAHTVQDMLPLSGWLHRPCAARFDPAADAAMDWLYGRRLVDQLGAPAWSPTLTLERRQIAEPGLDHRLRHVSRALPGWKAPPPAGGPAVSLILVLNGRFTLAQETVAALVTASPGVETEILLVDNGLTERDLPLAEDWARRFANVRLIRAPQPLRAAVGANIGGLAARGTRLAFVSAGVRPRANWLRPIIDTLREASSTQPRLLAPDGRLRSQGLRRGEGLAVAPTEEIIAVRAEDFRSVGGFDPLTADGPMMADLALRLAEATGRPFRVAPSDLTIAGERALSFAVNVSAEAWVRRRWGALTPVVTREQATAHFRQAGRDVTPLRIALKVCFANEPEANSGDWHFARSLARALEAEGCRARVDGSLDWYASPQADDVALMLRGRWRYRPSRRHLNLMWVISHPDAVRPAEISDYDHVFAASPHLAALLGAERETPVTPLLQCTDPDLFHPPEISPEARGVVFVANSRGVERRIAHQAVEERLPVEIHGRQWDRFAARALVRGPGLANAEVAELYRRSIVLNDHWADMRVAGILSNRLFDAAACAAPVISDAIAGLEDTFHGLISAWRPGEPLAPLVRAAVTEDDETRARRLALAREVMAVHSFGARAREIVAVAQTGLARLAAEPNRRERAD